MLKEEEDKELIGVLIDYLKKMLYLSLKKSLLLNKVYLNLLNSF